MDNTKTITTHSPEETIEMGSRIAANLRGGDFIALMGELGTGKTMFVKGLAKGLGVGDYIYVNSPYFYNDGIAVVEWADKIRDLLPEDYLEVSIFHSDGNERRFEFRGCGEREGEIVAMI